ncbi:DHBP synthase RibB-like alpha/beta domain-containing protein [Amylostereum chailletii]|nr:DHBP synthase RibB-like alpha/beta domain-containing protein [Amylostereum chailletii]
MSFARLAPSSTLFHKLSQTFRFISSPFRTAMANATATAAQTTTPRVLVCRPDTISFPSSLDGAAAYTDPETENAIALAAAHLLPPTSSVVVFPTETVYGLGANALDAAATARIFATKGRPADNPLIVHVSSRAMLASLLPDAYAPSRAYEALMRAFWPGALTLLFPYRRGAVPALVTAGQPTVAVRMPSHAVARAVIARAGVPIAAPSANSSGKPSPTRAGHVVRDLGAKVEIVLDGGACEVGLESTVVDGLGADGVLRVLRPGGVTVEAMERVLAEAMGGEGGEVPRVWVHRRDYVDEEVERAPTTPGMKYSHYSPSVPVTLLHTSSAPPVGAEPVAASDFFASLGGAKVGLMASEGSRLAAHARDAASGGVEWVWFPLGSVDEPAVSAQRLFDGLLTLEEKGVDLILVEEVAEEREGLAFMNRIRKAAGEARWVRV